MWVKLCLLTVYFKVLNVLSTKLLKAIRVILHLDILIVFHKKTSSDDFLIQ